MLHKHDYDKDKARKAEEASASEPDGRVI